MMLLDTCALLWLVEGSARLSAETKQSIDREAIVAVSAISAFEIALKYRHNKLTLPMPPEEWWERSSAHHRIDILDLTPAVAMRATRLPAVHKDPADRFIIATAM
ncbi:MAG: type II toxin-antitoxin system VapC family toxin, partial [Spirochaetales bacterium]